MLKGFTFDENLEVPSWADGALYSMLLSKETGIWNKFDKCDVTAPIDYDTTAGFATIKFNKGAISVCGRVLFIDQNTEFKVPLTATQTGSIGVRINLSKPVTEQYEFYSKTTQSLVQEDLNDNRLGKYEFEIFKYTSTGGSITLNKQENYIESSSEVLEEVLESDGKTAKKATEAKIAEYASVDTSKGTIEERLTALGFKSGTVDVDFDRLYYEGNETDPVTTITNYVVRQGNFVIGEVEFSQEVRVSGFTGGVIATIPSPFDRLKGASDARLSAFAAHKGLLGSQRASSLRLSLRYPGDIVVGIGGPEPYIKGFYFAYEAYPIK